MILLIQLYRNLYFGTDFFNVVRFTQLLRHNFCILFIILALQSLVDFSLFQNCPPLLSVMLRTSPVPRALTL